MSVGIVVLVVGILAVVMLIGMYNHLVMLRQQAREAWAAIETELRRRFDLIPNLVETVKGYATHERETLEAVMQARNATNFHGALEDQVQSQATLSSALGRLMAVSEAYPQLKANDNFTSLQNELSETETRISQSRRYYNAVVKEYNTACETFPNSLIASSCGFRIQPYYGIDDARAYDNIAVDFGSTRGDAGQTLKVPQRMVEKDSL